MDSVVFVVVCAVTAMVGWMISRLTRHITFYSAHTDNQKQVLTAASVGQWRWPSEMHKCVDGGLRTRMKDVFVLCLVAMQRALSDRTSDYPIVILCVVANSVAAVLVFLIAGTYWNMGVGLLAWALLVACLWPYQLTLFGAHICVANMFFLASVYLMQQAEFGTSWSGLAWYFASGVAVGLMLFSSGSSRKYLPLVAGAFVYSEREALWGSGSIFRGDMFPSVGMSTAIICVAVALLLGAVAIPLSHKRIVTAMYFERAPFWLNRVISGRKIFGVEHYLKRAQEFAPTGVKFCVVVAAYLVAPLAITRSDFFFWSQLWFALGIGAVVLLLTYPDVILNLWAYYADSQGWKTNRFSLYRKYFTSIGKPIKDDMRGGGLLWLVRFFGRMMPVHFVLYLICLPFLATLLILDGNRLGEAWGASAIFIVSLSPVLLGEITHSAQSARLYYPGLLGLLLLIAYTAFQLDQMLAFPARLVFWSVTTTVVLVSAVWALWMLLDDVLPARMAVARLGQALKGLGIKEFYTYNTPYNEAFVDALPSSVRGGYKIHFINTLKEVKEGYVVVPGTSSKALNMESAAWAIEHGDFDLDPELNHLIESKEIGKYAVVSFKTFGTSRIWAQESEVTSYRDLILREIGDEDRWRGWAWILDAGKLRAGRYR